MDLPLCFRSVLPIVLGGTLLFGTAFASARRLPIPPAGNNTGSAMSTGDTLELRKDSLVTVVGNLEITLREVVTKLLPPNRRCALKVTLMVRRDGREDEVRLMVRDGWKSLEGIQLSLLDGDPGKGLARVALRPLKPALVALPVSGSVLYLAKVGEADNPPTGDAYGKPEYIASLRSQGASRILLYVLLPNALLDAHLAYREASDAKPLPAAKPIFRHPGSPMYTFVVVDPDLPGTLVVKTPMGNSIELPLSGGLDTLASTPVHRNAGIRGSFPVEDLPPGFHNLENPESKGPSGLSEELFWSQPLLRGQASDFAFTLLTSGKEAMVIDAPRKVYLNQHETVPLIGFHVGETIKLREHSFRTTTRLVLSHLETGSILVEKADVASPPGMDESPPSPGDVVNNVEVDLARFMLPKQKLGRYAAIMVSGPESSNRVYVELFPSREAETSRDGQEALHRMRIEGKVPGDLLIGKAVELIQGPEPQGKDPIWEMALSRKSDSKVSLRLVFRLKGLPRFIFPDDKLQVDENGKKILASLPVTFVGFDGKRNIFMDKSVGIPILTAPSGTKAQPLISGSVTLSLDNLAGKAIASAFPKEDVTIWAFTLDQAAFAELKHPGGTSGGGPR